MLSRLRFHSVKTKLLALGGLFGIILIAFTLIAASTFSSMDTKSTESSKASRAEATADEAYQHWASDDGQSNMYVAVLALRDPSQLKLADTTWGEAMKAYKDAGASLDKAAKFVSTPSERRLVTALPMGPTIPRDTSHSPTPAMTIPATPRTMRTVRP